MRADTFRAVLGNLCTTLAESQAGDANRVEPAGTGGDDVVRVKIASLRGLVEESLKTPDDKFAAGSVGTDQSNYLKNIFYCRTGGGDYLLEAGAVNAMVDEEEAAEDDDRLAVQQLHGLGVGCVRASGGDADTSRRVGPVCAERAAALSHVQVVDSHHVPLYLKRAD